jgi:hypothetical protein
MIGHWESLYSFRVTPGRKTKYPGNYETNYVANWENWRNEARYFELLMRRKPKLRETLSGAREVLLQGSFYEVSLALVGVASLAYFQY